MNRPNEPSIRLASLAITFHSPHHTTSLNIKEGVRGNLGSPWKIEKLYIHKT